MTTRFAIEGTITLNNRKTIKGYYSDGYADCIFFSKKEDAQEMIDCIKKGLFEHIHFGETTPIKTEDILYSELHVIPE